jgi:hypothetical protein
VAESKFYPYFVPVAIKAAGFFEDAAGCAREHYLKVLELDPHNTQANDIRFWFSANLLYFFIRR